MTDQPFVDFPLWDEPLSKIPAPFDIGAARQRLALHFNTRPPQIPAAVREREIDRAWEQHRSSGGAS